MKKLLLTLLLLFSVGMVAKAVTEELTVSGSAFIGSDNITVSINQANGGTPPRWDETYVRVYAKNTITIKGAEGITITKVVFSTESRNGTFLSGASSDKGSFNGTSKTWTGSENSFVITNGTVKSGHTRINKITVTYEEETAGPKEPKDFTGFDKLAEEGVALYVGKSMDINLPANAPEITYQSSNAEVAKVENGSIVALAVGEAEIVASWNLVAETWNAGEKTIKVVVMEAPDGLTIQFISDGTSDSNSAFTTTTELNSFITEGTEYVSGIQSTNKVYKGKGGLKFSSGSSNGELNLSLSADAQIYCKQIVVRAMKYGSDSSSLSVNGVSKDITATEYTDYVFDMTSPYAKIETLELAATKRLYVQSVMLVEAKPELVSEPIVNIKHGSVGGVLTVDYTFTVAHYDAKKHSFDVTLSVVDGNNDIVFEDVTPAVNAAPARANAESTVFHKVKTAKHESLKGATPQVSVVATLNGAEVHNKTYGAGDITTTGIEDVMVEGEGEAEYFNLQGLRVAQPEAGQLYIKRQGGNAVKVRF